MTQFCETPYLQEYLELCEMRRNIPIHSKWRWLGSHVAYIEEVSGDEVYYRMNGYSYISHVSVKEFMKCVSGGKLKLIPDADVPDVEAAQ